MHSRVFAALVRALWPSLDRADLERPLFPANMTFSDKVLYALPSRSWSRSMVDAAGWVRIAVISLVPVGYEIYLYVLVFREAGASDPFTWLSAAIATLLFCSGFAFFGATLFVYERE